MIQKECSYCGAVVSVYVENCEICGSAFPLETVGRKENGAFNERKSAAFPEKAQVSGRYDLSKSAERDNKREHKCTICGQAAMPGRSRCYECRNYTSGNTKAGNAKAGFEITRSMIALLILGAISIFGVVSYFYFGISEATPEYILKKYETATGIDKSINYKNYVLKGKGVISVSYNGTIKATKDIIFIITFEKPNKFSREYWAYDSKEPSSPPRLILKQVYNGLTGKQYDNIAGELSDRKATGKITALSDENIGINEMGLGFDVVDADYEIAENQECLNMNRQACDLVTGSKYYKVENTDLEIKPSRKISLQVNRKTGVTKGKNILEFDGDTGYLLRNIRDVKIEETTQSMIMLIDEYKKFSAPSKSPFGTEKTTDILVPTKLTVNAGIGAGFEMKMKMNFENLEFNQNIDESVYDLPSAK